MGKEAEKKSAKEKKAAEEKESQARAAEHANDVLKQRMQACPACMKAPGQPLDVKKCETKPDDACRECRKCLTNQEGKVSDADAQPAKKDVEKKQEPQKAEE